MEKGKQLAEALKRYGEGSATSLEKMRSDIQGVVQSAPPWLDELAGGAARLMPGVGLMDSMRLSSEAGGRWREGDYPGALEKFSDAMLAPVGEVLWATPGGGFVKKVSK